MDNVGIVVESLDAAIAFFTELGLELEGRATIEGDWSGRVTGLRGQRVEMAMMRMPDGHGKIELSRFLTPPPVADHRNAPVKALADAIAKLPGAERKMAEKIDAIVRKHAPMLASKTYYGMPGWARDGKVCVFMQPASKFKVRYCTIGFDPTAKLDDGDMWPT